MVMAMAKYLPLMHNNVWARCDFDGNDWTVTYANAPGTEADTDLYTPSLADFNGDGQVELYAGGQIWNANFTGDPTDLIADNGINYFDLGGSVAYDVLEDTACADCQGLELVAGGQVYSVNINAGTLTLQTQIDGIGINQLIRSRGTSLADMDNDGDIDVVYNTTYQSNQWLYVWDGQTPEVFLAYNTGNQWV